MRKGLEKLLGEKGWKKQLNPNGYPEASWLKPPISSTRCEETSLIGAIKRQLQIEDDFYE